ncbi:MAG TPA: F0F1 ATP synthase subunit epsilon [Dehalococcoidales bacterium]|nr:F0F1 ATP synthase subunit epsilon [Dehalococcoidales bacterium]
MAGIRLDIVTAEQLVFSEDVDLVVAPGIDGEMAILPHHAPLMTMLQPGELLVRQEGKEFSLAVTGGFLEVRPDRVTVLADAAERAEDIDAARAEEAKQRAQERLAGRLDEADHVRVEAALRRSLIRLRVAEKRRRRRAGPQSAQ